MTEFKVNRERQKVLIREVRSGEGIYHADDFQKFAEEFSSKHPVPAGAVGLRFFDRCECGEYVSASIHMHAHRDETDIEMNERIQRETYDAERGMKDARAREEQLRKDRLKVLSLIIEDLGEETVRKVLAGEKVS